MILSRPEWADREDGRAMVKELMYRVSGTAPLFELVLSKPCWSRHRDVIDGLDVLTRSGWNDPYIIRFLFPNADWAKHRRAVGLVEAWIREGGHDPELEEYLLSRPEWREKLSPALSLGEPVTLTNLRRALAAGFTFDLAFLVDRMRSRGYRSVGSAQSMLATIDRYLPGELAKRADFIDDSFVKTWFDFTDDEKLTAELLKRLGKRQAQEILDAARESCPGIFSFLGLGIFS